MYHFPSDSVIRVLGIVVLTIFNIYGILGVLRLFKAYFLLPESSNISKLTNFALWQFCSRCAKLSEYSSIVVYSSNNCGYCQSDDSVPHYYIITMLCGSILENI